MNRMRVAGIRATTSPIRRSIIAIATTILLIVVGGARRHDAHVTQSRVVIEQGVLLWRVRCFADDLEKGVRGFANAPALVLATDPHADSLVTAYFNARVFVHADGRRLRARLVERTREADVVGGAVQIYTLRLDAGTQPKTVTVRNGLLFEQFSTQQNLVILVAMPGKRRRSLYFAGHDDTAQTVTF